MKTKTQRRLENESQTEQDQSPIQSTDLYELLVSLCTIIIVHNTVNIPLAPHQHHISDAAKRR